MTNTMNSWSKRYRSLVWLRDVVVVLTLASSPQPVVAQQATSLEQDSEYPSGELGKMVRLGEEIVAQTAEHPLSESYVGNTLKVQESLDLAAFINSHERPQFVLSEHLTDR